MVQLSAGQLVALKQEEIENVEDLEEFEDNSVNNVIQNLRGLQDIWHSTIPANTRSAEITDNTTAKPPVLFQAAVAQSD